MVSAELSKILNTPVHIITDVKDITDSNINMQERKRSSKGWMDKNGEIYIVLPNATNANDAKKTILHEIVAHKGLRGLLGKEKFDNLCDNVWNSMSELDKIKFGNKYGSHREAADEYMASLAENDVNPTTWEMIKGLS